MKYRLLKAFIIALLSLNVVVITTIMSNAQHLFLDRSVPAGELTLLQDIKNANEYYYVIDKPSIALNERGKPQFSFLQYAKNSDAGVEGGGIVHAVITLNVSDEQVREAERELRRINPEAEIKGAAMWRGGTVSLVSSFTNPEGELTEQVIGIGNAPILDGQKTAISIQLTQRGAEILRESFNTPTPDLSISFEMELEGYRSPKNAVIEADFERVYEHKAFSGGIATPYLAADINAAFDDLRNSGAIKVTQFGEDDQMAKIIETAYQKLSELMFQPLGGTGSPNVQQLSSTIGGVSMMDRASKILSESRREAKADNQRIRQENRQERELTRQINDQRLAKAERDAAQQNAAQQQAQRNEAAQNTRRSSSDTTSTAPGRPLPRSQQDLTRKGKIMEYIRPDMPPGRVEIPQMETPDLQEEVAVPQLAIAASFEMKKVRMQGSYRIDLNKSTIDIRVMPFDVNIGAMASSCEECFHKANLDDPLYKQRSITAFVDGLNAEDFGEYINFVTVTMKKQHQGGDITVDEIRIDRNNFNQEGNNFSLLYGWKDDQNREKWLDYDYQTVWSFFGGVTLEVPEQTSQASAINLAPPFRRKRITLEADPSLLEDAEVRLVNVKVFYELDGKSLSKQATLRTRDEALEQSLEFMLPADETDYEYEIKWIASGNQVYKSDRQKTSMDILLVDDVPLF